jgi:predicted Fe-S protein YdhL (DUF1289 family)
MMIDSSGTYTPEHATTAGANNAVPSPCNAVCRMDPASGLCIGCQRTIEEIAGWSGFDDERRRQIWVELAHRRGTGA